jgi:trigger factor
MEKRAAAEARHAFGDRIVDFATSNASVELPEVMVANEIEIMRDELRTRLAQQRIGMDQYLALVKQSPEELATELREPATRRVKTLLVLSAIAEKEGVDATDEEIDAEIAQQLERYGEDAKLREYLTSRRGRSYLRMTLRNRTLVDRLIERALGTDASAGESPTDEPATADITEQPEEST